MKTFKLLVRIAVVFPLHVVVGLAALITGLLITSAESIVDALEDWTEGHASTGSWRDAL